MLPAGKYEAVATDHDWGKSKNDKTQVVVAFQILEGPHSGQFITWYGYFSGRAADITIKALRTCGWKGDDLSNLGTLDQRVSIVVEHEDYDGKTQAKVRWINSPGSGVVLKDPLGKDDLRMFAASMQSKCAAIKEVAGVRVDVDQAQPPTPQEEPPPPGDADIPF